MNSRRAFINQYGRVLATGLATTTACLMLVGVDAVFAGGYVDGVTTLNPAKSVETGAVSALPTFENSQFNDQVLVGTIHNDPIRTPSTADPISTVSGNNYHDETDFVISGRNGLNIVFTRTYNSAPSSTKLDRGMGFGWTHSYLMRLKSNDFGVCPNCTSSQRPENANNKTSSVTYTDERGGEQNYLVNETSHATSAPEGVYDVLALDSPSAGQHTLSFRNGVRYVFEAPTGNLKTTPNVVARLKYVENAWGDRLTLAYDGSGRLSTLTDNLGIAGRTGITFTYHPGGQLRDVADWTGRRWQFLYDGSTGNLAFKINPLNEQTQYWYADRSSKSLLSSILQPLADPTGGPSSETVKFNYYQNGRAFQQKNALDQGDTLDYDLYRKSTRVTDARGGVREYHYDENGRMTKLVEPDGGVLLFENQDDAIRSKKYDALGYATTYSYRVDRTFAGTSDANGNVTREQDALGRTVDLSYGPLDQIASSKDKRGTTLTTTFGTVTSGCERANRPKEQRISALGGNSNVLLASFCWNSNATLNYSRLYLDAVRYRETRVTYEPASNGLNVSQEQVVGMPSGASVTKTYTYDSLGRKKTETLRRRTSPTNATPLNLTTTYDYDVLDRVVKVTDSLGNEVVNTYASNGRPLVLRVTHRYKKPDGSFEVRDVVTRTYDVADRVKTEADAEGNVTTYSYDEAGNVIAVTDAEGHTSRFEYDPMNRRTAVIDATGYRTVTNYNARGDVVGVQNANGEKVAFEIDALGRKTAVVDAKGFRSEFAYDENDNLTCTIDANAQAGLQPKNAQGCSESRVYDELNRVTKITDALGGETSFTYDLAGNRLTVKDAEAKTWSFAYDDLGRLTSETDHSAKVIAYKRDEAGNVYEKTNRLNEVTRYTFDNGNRLTRVDYLKDNTAETFGYDPAGNRNAAANHDVGYAFGWDRLNRLVAKLDSRGRSLNFTYDRVGNILTKTTYQGSTTSYVYNASNRLVMLRNPDYTQVDYQYNPAGRLLSRVSANGARMTQSFDANGWLTKLDQYDAANALVSSTTYTRDRVGNIISQVEAGGTSSFTLDALYRLTRADYPAAANDELFTYDKVGNRKTYTKGSLSQNASTRFYNYTAGTNRLADIRIGSATGALESGFTSDFEGRLTNQTGVGAKVLSWDAKGRVKTVGGETYSYDPMDYRVGRSGGALGNRSYFLEGEHLESEYSGSNLVAKYFRGSSVDELVAAWMVDSGDGKTKPYLFHQDQVTSTTAVTGHNGGTTQAVKYSAFGQVQSNAGSSPSRLKYTGREDDGNGLMYYRARYYDAAIGRFVSEDQLGFVSGDVNLYAYVGNNPINASDPSGNVALFDNVAGAVIAGGVDVAAQYAQAKLSGQSFDWNWRQTAVATGFGFVTSGASALLGSGVKSLGTSAGKSFALRTSGNAAIGAIANVGQAASMNYIDGKNDSLTAAAMWGGGFGALGSVAGDSLSSFSTAINQGKINALSPGEQNLYAGIANLSGKNFGGPSPLATAGSIQLGNFVGSLSSFNGQYDGGVLPNASGGFLLYPNKPNNNQMQLVYSK